MINSTSHVESHDAVHGIVQKSFIFRRKNTLNVVLIWRRLVSYGISLIFGKKLQTEIKRSLCIIQIRHEIAQRLENIHETDLSLNMMHFCSSSRLLKYSLSIGCRIFTFMVWYYYDNIGAIEFPRNANVATWYNIYVYIYIKSAFNYSNVGQWMLFICLMTCHRRQRQPIENICVCPHTARGILQNS